MRAAEACSRSGIPKIIDPFQATQCQAPIIGNPPSFTSALRRLFPRSRGTPPPDLTEPGPFTRLHDFPFPCAAPPPPPPPPPCSPQLPASPLLLHPPALLCAAARRGEHAAHFLHVGHRANPFGHHGRACFGQAVRQSRGSRGGWSTRSSVGQCVSTRSSFSATSVPMTPGPSMSEWSACQLLPGLRPGGRQKRFAPWFPAGVARLKAWSSSV